MALTNNNLEIIKALAHNDMHQAKLAALASLAEDKSKKNAQVVNHYRKLLSTNASTMMANLPSGLQTVLVGSAPSEFDPERYYLREPEASVLDDIRRMKLVAEEMADRRIPYRNTTLLYGASGTGKTELGKYIAHELDLPFFYISFVSTIDSYMGSTAKNIHKVFSFCNSIPCVLMLDEVDCVAARRCAEGSRGADGELERTTISLMQELDQLHNHVVLIAATNRLDMVDEAMLRRFSIRHEIKAMSSVEMEAMIRQYLTATSTANYFSDADIAYLAVQYSNPGQMMPELIRMIGKRIYEEKKDILAAPKAHEEVSGLWEVTYTWKANVAAETEEDAIALGRRQRTNYHSTDASERYTAKMADFVGPKTI